MVRLFVRFLRDCYGVPHEEIALTISCFLGNGLSRSQIESWWLRQLSLPETCLRPTITNRGSGAGSGDRRVLLHGTARLVVHSTEIVQSIYGAIQEYGDCDRPEWLDLQTS